MEQTKRTTASASPELPATTTKIVGNIRRVDEREHYFARIRSGEFGPELAEMIAYMSEKHPLGATLFWAARNIGPLVDGPVADRRVEVRDVKLATTHIKNVARFLRADLVGICELPHFAVYSHRAPDGEPIELSHKYAIAIGVDQDFAALRGTTGADMFAGVHAWRAYSIAGYIAVQLAHYIRSLGHPARAHIIRAYQVVVPPILLFAGFGEISRVGIVLNPKLGMRFKAAVVTTDFPLEVDQPIAFGLQDFCSQCGKCAEQCPAKAITSGGKSIHNGYETWVTDYEKCAKFRVGNKAGATCGRCIKVCPWNRPQSVHHRIGTWLASRYSLAQKLLIKIDEMQRANLRAEPSARWWEVSDFADDFSYPWWPGIKQM